MGWGNENFGHILIIQFKFHSVPFWSIHPNQTNQTKHKIYQYRHSKQEIKHLKLRWISWGVLINHNPIGNDNQHQQTSSLVSTIFQSIQKCHESYNLLAILQERTLHQYTTRRKFSKRRSSISQSVGPCWGFAASHLGEKVALIEL